MSSASPGKSYHHGALREALLASAERLMAQGTGSAFTLREVARAAGVSHNAPYNHFADKQALLGALAARGFDRMTGAMERALAQGGPSDSGIKTLARTYVGFAAENPARYRLMFSAELAGYDGAEFRQAASRAFAVLCGQVGDTREPGRADVPGREARPLAAWALVHGLSTLILDGRLPAATGDRARENLADEVATILIEGLGAAAPRRSP